MYKITLINDGKRTVIHYPNFSDVKVLSGQIKTGINVAGEFVFNIAQNNPGYNIINPLTTLIEILNTKTNKIEFEGRISKPYDEMDQNGLSFNTFECEGELAYLNDSSQRHGEYHDISVREFLEVVIDNHNRDVADSDIDKTFEVGIVDFEDNLYRYLGYESTWETIKDKLLDRLGGELRVRKENGTRYLDYMIEVGEVKHTEIKLAKNLKSISREVDPTEVVTRLIPLGETIDSEDEEATDASQARLTIENVNDGKDYIIDQATEQAIGDVIIKSEVWDDITQPDILKTRGEQYLQDHNRIKTSYQVGALDLSLIDLDIDSFEVYNWYPVINPLMEINEHLRVIGKTIDVLNPEKSSLEIGDKLITASQYQYEANKSQRKVVELESTVERQSERLSAIQQEMKNVDGILDDINEAIGGADIPALETAISNLNEAVSDLTDAVDNIPDYEIATETTDGLMSADDKAKLNLITVLNSIDLDDLKEKLDLITVTDEIDLDDLLQRVEDLENEED